MARNLVQKIEKWTAPIVATGLLLFSGCATIPYNPNNTLDNSQLVPLYGVYVPKGDRDVIKDIVDTTEAIKNGDIKVYKVETGDGQWEYFLDKGVYRMQLLSKEAQLRLGVVAKEDATINGGKDLLTKEEALSGLDQAEREYAE